MEHFKKIKGYPNYLISDQGRVYSCKRKKFLKLRKDKDGYLRVDLSKNGIVKTHTIHRLVANAFIPNPENKETVNHIDGIKINNFVENLEWATHSENTQHGFDNGLMQKGSEHVNSKLNEDQVLEIRKLYKTGDYTKTALGKIFCVSDVNIGDIINRKRWKHI